MIALAQPTHPVLSTFGNSREAMRCVIFRIREVWPECRVFDRDGDEYTANASTFPPQLFICKTKDDSITYQFLTRAIPTLSVRAEKHQLVLIGSEKHNDGIKYLKNLPVWKNV